MREYARHSRFLFLSSPTPVLDIYNRGSSIFAFPFPPSVILDISNRESRGFSFSFVYEGNAPGFLLPQESLMQAWPPAPQGMKMGRSGLQNV